jgi:hypothetical protein
MNILDTLKVEHGLFYFLFDWIRNQAVANPVTYKVNGSCIMVGRAIESHAKLEEELLFSALEPRLGRIGPSSCIIHRDEHKKIAQLFADGAYHSSATVGGLLEAVDFARHHFRQEEAFLFPMAARLLSQSHMERLGRCWVESRGLEVDLPAHVDRNPDLGRDLLNSEQAASGSGQAG